jgi:hypothetical protein
VIQIQVTDDTTEAGGDYLAAGLKLYFPAMTLLIDEGF